MEIQQEKSNPFYTRPIASPANRLSYWISRHWIAIFALIMGTYVGLPFLAPVFMRLGWSGAANVIYFVYSFQCHQLPQRSFFLFGPKMMVSLGEVQAAWQNTTNPLLLRQFIGNSDLGWKVAWSDRMVYMYGGTLIFGLIWAALRRSGVRHARQRLLLKIPWWGLLLFLLPMAVDGTTHLISDLAGLSQGFRYTNAWLAALTNNAFSPSFYIGNALGSFNSWMRLISGVSFGIGLVWFGFPYLDEWFADTASISSKPNRVSP